MRINRTVLIAAVLLIVGTGITFLVVGFLQNSGNADQVNITITPEDAAQQQVSFQSGAQEGDAAAYAAHVSQLTLGRLGKEQPTVDATGDVVYRDGDQVTYTLITADAVTAPFKVFTRVTDASGLTVSEGDLVEMNQGANSFCCIVLPADVGEYTLQFFLEDETQIAGRYFVKR
jgi:hypothetical protein